METVMAAFVTMMLLITAELSFDVASPSTTPAFSFQKCDFYFKTPPVKQHFPCCGTVIKVAIVTDKFGQPKGLSCVEFLEQEDIHEPLALNESELHGCQLKNKPLTNEIEAALQKKHVICYLKYYEKESQATIQRRYPVLKMYSEAEMHEYNLAQDKTQVAAIGSQQEIALDHIGSSSTTPKTPANKDVIINAGLKDSVETLEMHSIGKIQQAAQIGVKRRLGFDAADTSPTANQAKEEPSIQLKSAQKEDKAKEDDPTNPRDSGPTKKTKGKDKET